MTGAPEGAGPGTGQGAAIVTIAAGPLTVEVAPAIGGSIAAFHGSVAGRRMDWLRPVTATGLARGDPLSMASFPLVPFCNRIRDGRFDFDGLGVHLPRNFARSPHAIHGQAWQMPWTVEDAAAGRLALVLDHPPGAWPWRFRARQTFALDPDGLNIGLAVENRGDRPMPLGFGHHPYFPRTPQASVTASVDAIWSTDAEVMPTLLERNEVVERLGHGLPVAAWVLDNNFTGWDGRAEIRWPERRAGLRLSAGEPFRFLVAYTPADEDLFVVEPVSNCTDWLNLRQLGPGSVGGTVLPAGGRIEGSIRLEPFVLG
ncbi:aldose 1-epimerase [Arenibaculum pallidiluteum]|uniref:aldose 1-epimerase n=1 Tax=Arenibaculum pallidiluteum TaxID=2812559 RepID=UPI001A97843E|nr:aldose 1-epimerase [Arenibaculum pallidiluteum]